MATDSHAGPPADGLMLGALLRAYRERALLTQEQLAERAGLAVRTIRGLESDRIRRPRSGSVRLLAEALDLTLQERNTLIAAAKGGPGELAAAHGTRSAGPAAGVGATAGEPVRPAQLPADLAEFTGRRRHLQQLDALLPAGGAERPAALVISAVAGIAGVGKTALAIHWAHRIKGSFPDGQLFVNLYGYAPSPPVRPVQALALLLHGLGVPADKVPVEVEAAAGLYRSLLAGKRVLIVLDNARDAEQVRPLLPGGPDSLVVVTSRDRLTGLVASHGARRLSLDVLIPEEAVSLLARILGAERVAAEPRAAAELAEVCGWLPLALRVAAANLASQPHQPLASYLAALRDGDRLAGLRVEGDPHSAVGVAFDHSYLALDPDARRLFRLLGVVPGPEVTVPAAAALAGRAAEQAGRLLEQLAAVHLLGQHTPGRYALHDLLRLHARQRTEDEDSELARQTAVEGLLGWYLHAADAAAGLLYPQRLRLPVPRMDAGLPSAGFDEQAGALAWLDAERANLVAAVQHAAERGPRAAAWLLADTIRGYFWFRRHAVDWLVVARAALAAAEAEGDVRAQAAAHLSLGSAHQCLDDHSQAVEHYSTALERASRSGWVDGQAATLINLGLACWGTGSLELAADHLGQALTLYRQTGRLAGQAIALSNLGLVYRRLGRLGQAADHYSHALTLYREIGPSDGEANTLDNLGDVDRALGLLDDAHDHLRHALALSREVGDRYGEAFALTHLAALHRDAGRHAQATEAGEVALALAHEVGDRRIEIDTLNTVGTIHLQLARPERAMDYHQRALDLARQTDSRYDEADALLGLAAVHQHQGQHTQAVHRAQQALALAGKGAYRNLEGQARGALASIHLDLDQPQRAIGHAREALTIQRATGHRLGQARALMVLGRALRHTESADAAMPHLRQALALFTEIGSPEADETRILLVTRPASDPDPTV